MKWYTKLFILVILIFIGYILGNCLPFIMLSPTVVAKEINSSEYYQLIIKSISTLATLLAVIVALFKEDIRKLWVYSKLEVLVPEENFTEVLKQNTGDSENTGNSSKLLEANQYSCIVEIINTGRVLATDVEIYLESLAFNGQQYKVDQSFEIIPSYIKWDNNSSNKINLPPEGKKRLCIAELFAPKSQVSTTGQNTGKDNVTTPKLIIGGIDNKSEFKNGKWTGVFVLHSSSTKPIRFILEIDWNGQWEKRVIEMKKHLIIKLGN
jgi:hypothetical protein